MLSDLAKRLFKFLISRRFAIWILITSVVLLVLAIILPEPETVSKTERPFFYSIIQVLGIHGITSSPSFLILPIFIFLSTFLCTIDRFRKRRAKDIGFWGSMVFHAGLLTVILAGVVSMLTLFSGEILLTEGFPASLGKEGFLKVWREPVFGVKIPEGRITLKGFKSIYQGNFPVDHESRVSIERDGTIAEATIKVNAPLLVNDIQYTLNRYGFSPAFVVEDEKGKILLDAFINLVVVGGVEDSFDIPEAGARVFVRFFPDFVMTKDGPITKSKLPNSPVVALKVGRDGRESKFILIKKGSKVEIMGLKFTFADLRYWNHFLVSRDKGRPVLAVGLFFLVSGLIIRFLTMERKREMS